jgi:hypothetical protein
MEKISSSMCPLLSPMISKTIVLAKDISGTHVLRSVFSLLAGLPVISERKVIK